ncbi:MAG TPA: NAD(P)H-dependent oxidoreductase [Polyangiaceae bacterium]|jgi:NAD(P)H-dependent FMN reductase|nr:NAD(P)H-dependent oxidoreductase [Polyangiaceae bacterium]
MTKPLQIGIVLGSTRIGRFADKPAQWVMGLAQKCQGMTFELLDLRDYPLPFFDQPKSPLREPSKDEVAQRWAKKLAELDGFVFVTGEYNHGIPAVLKNALDHVYAEFNRKPATFVGYGNAGGARAIEQLRLMLVELQVAPLRGAVHLSREQFVGMLLEGKTFADYAQLEQAGNAMLLELGWWAEALRTGRERAFDVPLVFGR